MKPKEICTGLQPVNDTVLSSGSLPESEQCQHLQTSNRKLNNCPVGNINPFTVVRLAFSKTTMQFVHGKLEENLSEDSAKRM